MILALSQSSQILIKYIIRNITRLGTYLGTKFAHMGTNSIIVVW